MKKFKSECPDDDSAYKGLAESRDSDFIDTVKKSEVKSLATRK